jgi:hypothetical protein
MNGGAFGRLTTDTWLPEDPLMVFSQVKQKRYSFQMVALMKLMDA